MCGIAGIVSADSDIDNAAVKRMQDALYHRGPDGEGNYASDHVDLAMRRLSIIDLEGGWQPLFNEDKSLVLVANAEIYNFVELRSELELCGHRFATGSDCEVILHLYEEYGDDCVNHLTGMFAFALWDKKAERLLLARDRMGEKPLYIYETGRHIVFSSELKSLLVSGLVPFELDKPSIHLYFYYQYVPEPGTPLKGVRKLPAAHTLSVDTRTWTVRQRCYWRMEDAEPIEGDAPRIIRETLEDLTSRVTRSDVPVGLSLSGGFDSSTIAALTAQTYPGTLHAFSIGYPGRPDNDERDYAKNLATKIQIPFHEIELTIADMVDNFPMLNYWRDEPIADISGFGYYEVMRLARDHDVPVMMQGHGGDELFWGYDWHRESGLATAQKDAQLNSGVSSSSGLPEGLTMSGIKNWIKMAGGKFKGDHAPNDIAGPPDRLVFYDVLPDFIHAHECVEPLYAPGFTAEIRDKGCDPYAIFTVPRPWPQTGPLLTRLICETYLLGNGIAQGDKLSMASSVEVRLPLMDHHFIETVIGLRKTTDDSKLRQKAWFKDSMKGLLPPEIAERPKRGFSPPVQEWYAALFEAYGGILKDGYLVQSGILTPEAANDLAEGPFPPNTVATLAFKALVLEMWCRQLNPVLDNVGPVGYGARPERELVH